MTRAEEVSWYDEVVSMEVTAPSGEKLTLTGIRCPSSKQSRHNIKLLKDFMKRQRELIKLEHSQYM
jgi:hypothetical protein